MCGIAGSLDFSRQRPHQELVAITTRMCDVLSHRGPDGWGVWADEQAGIALGHRRLAILDLSDAASQPMVSQSGRFIVAFNGEIYNFIELRALLTATTSFRGHSDTEVMLAAFERWEVTEALRRFNGMFALALWDRREQVLHLARDRFGEKPLYYGWAGASFVFGSELKALRLYPGLPAEINRDALVLLFRHGYIPGPHSIYQGVSKLPPATCLTVDLSVPGGAPRTRRYWEASEIAEQGCTRAFEGTELDAISTLESLLLDAVRIRMIADVPLGALLSGGIDSSLLVALMQAQSSRPVRTFTIGFEESEFDEAAYACEIAEHLGADHTELYVTPAEAMEVIPRLPTLYDEPFADSSQIPTCLVAQLARRDVTVVLSGDGADEVFGGYRCYSWGNAVWEFMTRLPAPMRAAFATVMTCVAPRVSDLLFTGLRPWLPRSLRRLGVSHKIHKLGTMLAQDRPETMYFRLVSLWSDPESLVPGATEPESVFARINAAAGIPDAVGKMMLLDSLTYLPDDILVKVDRASMAVGLESRAPYLDHRVVEFAWRLPSYFRRHNQPGKRILRGILSKRVPPHLFERGKRGFAIPLSAWLRGPLRVWADDLLDEARLRRQGYLNPTPITQKWKQHRAGTHDWSSLLWTVLTFQAWVAAQNRSCESQPEAAVTHCDLRQLANSGSEVR
ncbi:MAG TPA: asparagine synthase (glutamine-hydrolyzing) [Bryobacteraceae bacterium]|nr:asparagine synthase (glutamine-hydrolyzing) [Bryobacteraceae bacterium]